MTARHPSPIARWRRLLGAASAFVLLIPAQAHARQQPATPSADSLVVSLLTMGPGEMIFDRFGHTAIRVQNFRTGLDSAWNWGMYDFNSPNFIARFVAGETRYWMAGYPTPFFVDYYRRSGRAVFEQDLALDAAGADSLLRFLRWNAREENKYYRYDYYLDNCSTRARDAIDLALGGALKEALKGPGRGLTWRNETLRLSAAFPLIAGGMTFALGPRADATLTRWEEAFAPMRLYELLQNTQLSSGRARPLVRAERTLVPPGAFVDAPRPPSLVRFTNVIALVIVSLLGLLARRGRTKRGARLALGAFGAVWHLIVGLAGALVLYAGLFTRHEFMAANGNVLLGTPISLLLVWWYPRAMMAARVTRASQVGWRLSLLAAGAAVLAALLHVVPGWSPGDWAPLVLVAPAHLALAAALWTVRASDREYATATATDPGFIKVK